MKASLQLPTREIPKEVYNHTKEPFVWRDMMFTLSKNGYNYIALDESVRKMGLGSLFFSFSAGQTSNLTIANSLAKVYHNGFNHLDFSLSEMDFTQDFISELIHYDFKKAMLVGRIEPSITLDYNDVKEVYNNQIVFKDAKVLPMISGKKEYGKVFKLDEYSLKLYSARKKGELADDRNFDSITSKKLRFECAFNRVSYLRSLGVNLQYVKDLVDKPKMEKLGKIMENTAKAILTRPVFDEPIKPSDLMIFYFFQNAMPEEIERLRVQGNGGGNKQGSTFKRDNKIYKDLLRKYKVKDYQFPKKVREKWAMLLAS